MVRSSKRTSSAGEINVGDDEDIGEDFKSVALSLLTKSSVYAVSQLVTSNGFGRKLLWFVVLMAGVFGCSYEIHRFLSLYFQYPVVITLEVENNWKLEFPAVTICNLNRIPFHYYECILRNKSIEECSKERCNMTEIPTSPFITNINKEDYVSCSNNFEGILSPERQEFLLFLSHYLKIPEEQREAIGYQASSFIIDCSFNGETCSNRNFTNFLSLEYGNCFTFNGLSESNTPLNTPYIGPNSGLEVTLQLDVLSYAPITSSAGARIVINEPKDEPKPEVYGINISPGFETSIAVQQISNYRLPYPYRDQCKNYDEVSQDFIKNQESCIQLCLQSENLRQCNCLNPLLPLNYSSNFCDIRNQTAVCCLHNVIKSLTSENTPCSCPLPCKSTSYDLTISTAKWPSTPYRETFMKNMIVQHIPQPCVRNLETSDNSNDSTIPVDTPSLKIPEMAKFKVFYRTLEQTCYKQEPMFQDSELFSQLGGQLGLWLGVSLVALFECIETVAHLVRYCIKSSGLKSIKSRTSRYQENQVLKGISSV